MPLTDAKLRSAKAGEKLYKISDSGGLYLLVKPNGSRLWRWKYRIAGKENHFAIGEYPTISLAEARAHRDDARKLVKEGVHPSHNRQNRRLAQAAESANTFQAVTEEWIGKKKPGWTPYYLRQVTRFMESDVYPYIGPLPIRSLTAAHLLEIVRRIEGRGAETVALLVRQWCSAVFRYAVATLRADGDPAAALRGAIIRPKVEHRKPLTRAQVAAFLRALDGFSGFRTTTIALRLALLTFVRTVELRAAEWSEIDFGQAEWRIPAERMKMREPHLVPLSTQALALLRELQTLTGNQRWLFPNYRRPQTCMSATTLNRALERLGFNGRDSVGFSAHGFRATASTILNEAGYRADVIERQLAHKERNTARASYNQAEYLAERRDMMQQWADLMDGLADKQQIPEAQGSTNRRKATKTKNGGGE
jgi:integrase